MFALGFAHHNVFSHSQLHGKCEGGTDQNGSDEGTWIGLGAPVVAAGEVRSGKRALVTGIRHWSTATYTRVAIDLGDNVTYEAARVPNPDRIYFDLHGARLAQELQREPHRSAKDHPCPHVPTQQPLHRPRHEYQ